MDCVIGIDPGLAGAIAIYRPGRDLLVFDTPTFYDEHGRQHMDTAGIASRLRNKAPAGASVFIERVGPMPRQGAGTAFRFGYGAGILYAVAKLYAGSVTLVTPRAWKAAVGIRAVSGSTSRDRKNASRARAVELFPDSAHLFARAKDDGRAEAALIAWYGAKL